MRSKVISVHFLIRVGDLIEAVTHCFFQLNQIIVKCMRPPTHIPEKAISAPKIVTIFVVIIFESNLGLFKGYCPLFSPLTTSLAGGFARPTPIWYMMQPKYYE